MNSSILYGEPTGHDTQIVETVDFKAYVVPSTPASQLKNADVVIIYCHGGGMIIGHPLQYLDDYKRWASKAKMKGKCVIFMGLQYRESPNF